MPFFFLLSGIAARRFSKNSSRWPSVLGIVKKFMSGVFFIICACFIVFLFFSDYKVSHASLNNIGIAAFGIGGFSGVFSPYWFLVSLCIISLIGRDVLNSNSIFLVSMIISVVLPYFMVDYNKIPTLALSTLYALSFYIIGLKYSVEKIHLPNYWCAILIFASMLTPFYYRLDMAARNYGPLFIANINSFFIAIIILQVSNFLCRFIVVNNSLGVLGLYSVDILLYHQAIQIFTDKKLDLSNESIRFFAALIVPVAVRMLYVRCVKIFRQIEVSGC